MPGQSRAAIVSILERTPLFGGLTKRQLKAIAAECSPVRYDDGQVIVKELDWGQHMIAITSGTAKVLRGGRRIAAVEAGAVIGEMSLIDGEPRSATVVADGPVEGVQVFATAFRKLIEEHPTMVMKLLVAQTSRLRDLDKRAAMYG